MCVCTARINYPPGNMFDSAAHPVATASDRVPNATMRNYAPCPRDSSITSVWLLCVFMQWLRFAAHVHARDAQIPHNFALAVQTPMILIASRSAHHTFWSFPQYFYRTMRSLTHAYRVLPNYPNNGPVHSPILCPRRATILHHL